MILLFFIGKTIENRRNRIIKLKCFLMSRAWPANPCERIGIPGKAAAGDPPGTPPPPRAPSEAHPTYLFYQLALESFLAAGSLGHGSCHSHYSSHLVGQHNVRPAGNNFCVSVVAAGMCIASLSSKAQLHVSINSCVSVAVTKASAGRNKG